MPQVFDISYEVPKTVRNISHDFRIAIYSFQRPYTDIKSDFNFSNATVVLYPAAVTSVSFGCSTAPVPGKGSFQVIGSAVAGKTTVQSINADLSTSAAIVRDQSTGNIIAQAPVQTDTINKLDIKSESVQNLPLDIGSLFSNLQDIIKPMDYVVIYTKDVYSNLWYGGGVEVTSPETQPKFVGIVQSITVDYNVTANQMKYTISFSTLLRLVELTRYSTEKSLIPILQSITGMEFGEFARNIVLQSKFIYSNIAPHEILKALINPLYPAALVGDRIEIDQLRGEGQSASNEELLTNTIMGYNYDTALNKLKTLANNKDFEFYTDESGKVVWKLPTLARGINQQVGNHATTFGFDPTDFDRDDINSIYHIHDFISLSIMQSESEIINIVSGPKDGIVNGMPGTNFNDVLSPTRYTYYIKGGKATPIDRLAERRFGFLDVAIRPIQMQNPIYYNIKPGSPEIVDAQLYYYDMKTYKNNIQKYYTATLNMIDDPRILCGMPCVIPLLARTGLGDKKGKVLPSIFYIIGTAGQYSAGKYPTLTLTLAYGRFIDEEFHNGIHLYNHLSSWWGRSEPTLFYEITDFSVNVSSSGITTIPLPTDLKDYGPNDVRMSQLKAEFDYNKQLVLTQAGSTNKDINNFRTDISQSSISTIQTEFPTIA